MELFAIIAQLLFIFAKSCILEMFDWVLNGPLIGSKYKKNTAKFDSVNFLLLLQPNTQWKNGQCEICKCFNGRISCGKICRIIQCQSGFELVKPKDQCCYCRRIGKYIF